MGERALHSELVAKIIRRPSQIEVTDYTGMYRSVVIVRTIGHLRDDSEDTGTAETQW